MTTTPLQLDVFVDVVCPWCLLGNEQLERVLAELGVPVSVAHHPFLLDPTTPPEGTDIPAMLTRKYGPDFRRIWTRLEERAREIGLDLDMTKQRLSYPTERAHTLIRHAARKAPDGRAQRALVRDLLKANFLDARNVSDVDVLAEISGPHGFSPDEVARLVTDPAELAETRADAERATASGIHGVPFVIFNRQFAVSGAQPEAVFRSALQQALA